jgi:hypothetical protein
MDYSSSVVGYMQQRAVELKMEELKYFYVIAFIIFSSSSAFSYDCIIIIIIVRTG